jgi:integrase
MPSVIEKNGAFHLRVYSTVNVNENGQPFKLDSNGKSPRKQQSVMLARKDDGQYRSTSSRAVLELQAAKLKQIETWEALASSGEERPPDGNLTVAEFYNTVFLPYVRANKELATSRSYERYWGAYLKDHFNGTKTLASYVPYQGTNFLEQCCRKFSTNTVRHIRSAASGIFSYAVSKGYIKANPWRDVKMTAKGQEMEDGYAYSPKEIELILEALERVTGREEYSATMAGMVIAVCFFAGLRPSEAAGLRWENVGADSITVKEAYVAGSHKGTKTGRTRTVVMLPQLRHRMRLWAMKYQFPTSGWVFPNQGGNAPINMNDLGARVIKNTLEAIGMDWEGLYACRRGFGTMMVLAGASAEETCKAMGNSIDVVMKHYFKDGESKLAASGIAKLGAALALASSNQASCSPRMLQAGEGQ